MNVTLAVLILLVPVTMGYAISIPDDSYTEFSVLTRDESGDLVSDDYPRNATRGEPVPLVLSIANHERSESTYTVVVRLQRVRTAENGSVGEVVESATLTRERVSVGRGESVTVPYELTPTIAGEHVRAQFLLYRGDPPADPRPGNAYRSLHLWLSVSPGDGSEPSNDAG